MNARPRTVGLGGDGDEVAALREVEEEFGVALDYTDAHNWSTAGDVYAALCKVLPAGEADRPGIWERFAKALCRETGISPATIRPESELLAEGGIWIHVVNGAPILLSVTAIAAAFGVAWLLL